MIIGITGHVNIEKIFNLSFKDYGEIYNNECFENLIIEITNTLKKISKHYDIEFSNLTLVSGMARGIDEIFAEIAVRNDLKLILSIPHSIEAHKNKRIIRGIRDQAVNYDKYLNYKNTIKINEIKKNYGGKTYLYANFARNKNIIDESEIVISFKAYESAGTNDAIIAAKKTNKYLGNVSEINKEDFSFNNFNYISREIINQKKIQIEEENKSKKNFEYNIKSIDDNVDEYSKYSKIMIIQGCNSLGKMGSGIANYLKNKFPKQANEYFNYYKENGLLVGDVIFTAEKSNLYFGNIISQEKIGKDKQYIEYRGFYDGLIKVKEFCENNNINIIKTPLIGTGLAGGDWGVIEYLYKEVFKNSKILIEFYEINEKHLNSCLLKIEERNLLRKSFSKKDFPENYNFDNLKFLNNSNIKIKIDNFKKEKQKENLNIISNSVIDPKLNKYKIKITNLGKNDKYIYIGRPSLWQNPFPTKSSKFSTNVYPLEESLKKYKEETLSKLKVKNFVKLLLENNEITLSCFCIEKTITINNYKINETPKCHGELLAEKIFEALKLELTQINENQLNNNENNINI